jgi:cytochrome c peroxidase
MKWTHRRNPRATKSTFTETEREGAIAFAARCERCHQARTAADDPGSRLPRDRWEALVLGGGPIVWACDAYEKTGVVPYVHEHGARVPSLRRLYKKRPYFTNGSAPDMATVLQRTRFTEASFSHAGGDGEALDASTIAAIAAFLDLL